MSANYDTGLLVTAELTQALNASGAKLLVDEPRAGFMDAYSCNGKCPIQ